MRDLERFALIVVDAGHQHRTRAMIQQFPDDPHALLGRFTRRVHRLGRTLPQVTMMIDQCVTHVGEGQARQDPDRVIGGESTLGHVVDQSSQSFGVHAPILARRPG
jgi:hypothetical protein